MRKASHKDFGSLLFRRHAVVVVVVIVIAVAAATSGLTSFSLWSRLSVLFDMDRRRGHPSCLSPFDIDNFMIDFMVRLGHDKINRGSILKDYKGESAWISRDPIFHNVYGNHRTVLLKVPSQRFFRGLP
mmetsp:Transcript_69374/g.194515  ORF Transcript_69374/g.194515 Transcript_69374/m.194515 type:complete len:129 (-) Transcript_69374:74-460(-)